MLRALKDEFSEKPREMRNPGVTDLEFFDEEAAERTKYEEENFTRLILSKKQRRAMERKQKLASLNRLEDFDDYRDLEAITSIANERSDMVATKAAKARSLEQYVRDMEGGSKAKRKSKGSVDVDLPIRKSHSQRASELEAARARRKAKRERKASGGESDDDTIARPTKKRKALDPEAAALYEQALEASKTSSRSKRKSSRGIHARKAPEGYMDDREAAMDGGKRAAGYQIMNNRGLRPHRNKEVSNPRKKGRIRYEKAVKKRRSQVADLRERGFYGGEERGIKDDISKSIKL